LVVGNTAVGSVAVDGGSDVNNSGQGTVGLTAAASTSSVTVDGAGSTWTEGHGAT
jgi:hypothetical protein